MRRMLFVRTYQGMLGGHLKVFEYLHHVRASGLFEPVLYLTQNSTQSPLEWLPEGTEIVNRPIDAHAYFVGGFNWRLLDEAGVDLSGKPVINLLQGLRHGAAGDSRQVFLSRAALRICVSPAVYESVLKTGLANGPLVTIPNGVDVTALAGAAPKNKARRVFIAGVKNVPAARNLAYELERRGVSYDLSQEMLARSEFLSRMGTCDIVVALPDPLEGFFLPPLEAMAMGCAVVLPQCPGASSYAVHRKTCLAPDFETCEVANAVEELRADEALRTRLQAAGRAMAGEHSLDRERNAFISALRGYMAAGEAC